MEELGLDKFWFQALGDRRGAVEWSRSSNCWRLIGFVLRAVS